MQLRLEDIDQLRFRYPLGQVPHFIVSATLASELQSTIQVARRISISSKNAQAITARAGSWGQGFSGITQFIDEFSRSTIKCAHKISETSRQLSQTAVQTIFKTEATQKVAKVVTTSPEARKTVADMLGRFSAEADKLVDFNARSFRQLRKLIDEIRDCTRALNSIVATCRIEASRAGPFQQSLFVIAGDIESAAAEINEQIKVSRKIIDLLGTSTLGQPQPFQRQA